MYTWNFWQKLEIGGSFKSQQFHCENNQMQTIIMKILISESDRERERKRERVREEIGAGCIYEILW